MTPTQAWASIVRLLIDACAAINLHNCGKLAIVCALPEVEIRLSPIVVSECGLRCATEIIALEAAGLIHFVPDEEISTERFLELLDENDIGDGEVESIAICESTGGSFCTDDAAARRLAAGLLGGAKVMGSLRLLKFAVEASLLTCTEAFAGYRMMRDNGGFLPDLQAEFFCNGTPA
jgi:predicted nucleic acid-binding protein